jgi:thiol-disulfide isomerase/thioredoxin
MRTTHIFFTGIFCNFILSCGTQHQTTIQTAQPASINTVNSYEISYDNEQKVLTGLLKRKDIESDTSFPWFTKNMQYGAAYPQAIKTLKEKAGSYSLLVFAGTWCEDSQVLLPQFYRLCDKAGLTDSVITLVGVNRKKETLYNLHQLFNITHVPTFIVMSGGKEVGRMVEYGKYGFVDQELGEIVQSISK